MHHSFPCDLTNKKEQAVLAHAAWQLADDVMALALRRFLLASDRREAGGTRGFPFLLLRGVENNRNHILFVESTVKITVHSDLGRNACAVLVSACVLPCD